MTTKPKPAKLSEAHIQQAGDVRPSARFGRLTVMRKSSRTDGKNTFWECVCDCGNSTTVTTTRLRNKNTSSCGCWQQESRAARAAARRNPAAREYRIWYGMIQRCYNPNNRAFKWYGARGIGVCEDWRTSFYHFLEDMGPSEGLELDRIENDEGYRLGNCRWADKITNANNRRSNVFIEHRGERLTIAQWARQIGISNQKMWGLLKRGHSIAFIEEEYAA